MEAKGRAASRKPEQHANVDIGLTGAERSGVVDILRTVVSDEFLVYTKTRNYHWNVTGPQFNDLHKFLDAQYNDLNGIVDEVAERIRSLGGSAPGTLQEFLKWTKLRENPGERPEAMAMISNLLGDHEAIIRNLRAAVEASLEKYHDAGTNNFLTDLMERHEKMAWMLRAFLTHASE